MSDKPALDLFGPKVTINTDRYDHLIACETALKQIQHFVAVDRGPDKNTFVNGETIQFFIETVLGSEKEEAVLYADDMPEIIEEEKP